MSANPEHVGELPRRLKIGWASGALGVALLMNGISGLVLFYMVGILKIEPAVAGSLVFLTKLFDVASDPIVGVASDRTRSRWGRRRPYLFVGAFVAAASFALIFTTPVFENQAYSIAYIFIALVIYTVGYTLFNVPYMAMPAEMTDSYHERSSIHGYRIWFFAIGQLLSTSGAKVALEWLGKTEWTSYALIGITCGGIVFVSMMVCFFLTRDARQTQRGNAIPSFRGDLAAIAANRHFIRLIGVKFAQLLGIASGGAAMLFFIINVLQLRLDVFAIFGVVVTISMIVSTPYLVRISKRLGKSDTYCIAAICFALYSASWILAQPGEPIWALCVRAAIVGVSASGNVLLAMSMLTDIINYDANVTGVRREGAYAAFYSFIEKLTAAFGPLIIGVALSFAGFDKSLPADALQSPAVRQALLLGVAYIPAAMAMVSIYLLRGYQLTEDELNKAGPSESAPALGRGPAANPATAK
jgi:GPH family glycoside/pentoside/hexuronide:cation symporter